MAKKSKIEKNKARAADVEKYRERREQIRTRLRQLRNEIAGYEDAEDVPLPLLEELAKLQTAQQKLPRDANPNRIRNRCLITGRPRAVYRKFGISRLTFRQMAHWGLVPGVRKSSW